MNDKEKLEKFRSYVEASHDIIYEVSPEGKILYVSPVVEDITGYSREEAMGADFHSFVLPEDVSKVQETHRRLLESGETQETEARMVYADGNLHIHHAHGSPLIDSEGKVVSIVVILRDMTEYKRMVEELRLSEERYRSYMENAPYAVFIADSQGNLKEANSGAYHSIGYSREELLSMSIYDLIHPDGTDQLHGIFLKLQTEGRIKGEIPFMHKNGEKRWVSFGVVQLSTGEFLGFHDDITEKKRMEESIKRSHDQLLTILECLEVGIFIVDRRSREILYVNSFLRKFFEADLIGSKCTDVFGYKEEICSKCPNFTLPNKEPETEEVVTFEYSFPAMGKWFLGQVRAIRWVEDTPASINILTDITSMKEAEQLKEDIDRITRHDLKTPLNGILGAAQLLSMDPGLSEEHKEYVSMLEMSGKRMLSIIDESLSIYKMEKGTYELTPEEVKLDELLETIRSEFSPAGRSTSLSRTERRVEKKPRGGVEIELRREEDPENCSEKCSVRGEQLLCYSLFSNLIKNAVEASEKGEKVIVTLWRDDSECVFVEVWNRKALPPKMIENFGKKYATAEKKQGTGLGLYSAILMAETQGGTVEWDSSEEGGTSIRVSLQAAPPGKGSSKKEVYSE